ncbi:MAG TPA: bifunctional glutamate N-acetyltransferase/amino-acid acetyltransferase ArgJ [Candidatus Treponema faecavium]|nr:bifunctional glutamate N-acetyltransferase/amino-acid acetyltransferase ArgJ [Candidatus Treponema faecavium]
MQFIDGGVTAPLGFTANGVLSGIKAGRTAPDTALIYSETPCTAAGVFTKNRVQAEPVKLTRARAALGRAQAVIVNSGNANACTGEQGARAAVRMAAAAAAALHVEEQDVLVCSTGVIGQQLAVERIEAHMAELVSGLSREGHAAASEAILTTDTRAKECAAETEIGGSTVRIGTMAKGSGMIHINMGTMLGFITTDCAITAEMLQKALKESAECTYNCVSVDGDTSTNDTLLILANGRAGNRLIDRRDGDYDAFVSALTAVNTEMAKKIAGDGEGAEHLIECRVSGAVSDASARALAKSVVSSNLVKAACFGKDANWGRILCALGYSGEPFTPEAASVSFVSEYGVATVYERGAPAAFDEEAASRILGAPEVTIAVTLADGSGAGAAWGCDLTYEYVKINGDYRT